MNMAKVECKICGYKAHFLEPHIVKEHNLTAEAYQASNSGALILSEAALTRLQEIEAESRNVVVEYDIKKTFGIEVSKKTTKVNGFRNPHATTPKIDPDYKFRKDQLTAILFSRVNAKDEKTLFVGPTGSGKTSALEQVAARLNLPYFRINMDADITRADFVGQWVLKGDEMEFMYGMLPRAMRTEMSMMVIDEWDCMNPSNAMALQAVLEGSPLTIAELAKQVHAAPGSTIHCTANTIGQGDESGMYSGTQVQNFAQLDRFTMVVKVDYPEEAIERKILESKCGLTDEKLAERFGVAGFSKNDNAKSIIDRLIETGRLVREAFLKQEVTTTMSTRTIVNIANKLLTFGSTKKAYELAYLNKLNSEDETFVREIIQRVWGA